MKYFRIIGLFAALLFTSCGWFEMDSVYTIYFKNNARDSIATYFTKPSPDHDPFYPDTTITDRKPYLLYISGDEKGKWNLGFEYKYLFDEIPSDTFSVFIFSADTLNKYTWAEVRDGYKILKRYDLSLEDLESMDYTITYP